MKVWPNLKITPALMSFPLCDRTGCSGKYGLKTHITWKNYSVTIVITENVQSSTQALGKLSVCLPLWNHDHAGLNLGCGFTGQEIRSGLFFKRLTNRGEIKMPRGSVFHHGLHVSVFVIFLLRKFSLESSTNHSNSVYFCLLWWLQINPILSTQKNVFK